MANARLNAPEAAAAEKRRIVLKEVGAKWGKFSELELSRLMDDDDLVTQIMAKYGAERGDAQRDVDALLNGRHISGIEWRRWSNAYHG